LNDKIGITVMTGALSDNDAHSAEAKECLCGRADQPRIRVYRLSRDVLDQVGLQQDRPAAEAEIE